MSFDGQSLILDVENRMKQQIFGKGMMITMWFEPVSKEGEEDAAPCFGNARVVKPAGDLLFAKHLDPNDLAIQSNMQDENNSQHSEDYDYLIDSSIIATGLSGGSMTNDLKRAKLV